MSNKQPLAFMSYVRFDDDHENGRLTEFRKRLGGEVKMQTGDDFPIFQDRNDIKWGQNWKERIDTSIDGTTFLIPIITPSFFKSDACRDELMRFIEIEKELNRNDLILPVYYVGCPLLNNKEECATDELAVIISERQRTDWRELRFEPLTSSESGKRFEELAIQIRDAMGRGKTQKKVKKPSSKKSVNEETAKGSDSESRTKEKRTPSAKTEPPTRVVDPMHRGDHATITEAIKAANPGDRILVRPGLYQEGIVMDKPLEIIGDGELSEIIVETKGKHVVAFRATMGRVSNLTLRQNGGDFFSVNIAQGRLEIDECDITSQGNSCIGIHGDADPRIRRNRIHDGKTSGVFVYENGKGTIEDNDIFENVLSGVEISKEGNPVVRKNRIRDGKSSGVFINENGKGTIEDNEIYGNTNSGVTIREGGNPIVRRNRIHDGKQSGVLVSKNGKGNIEDNEIYDNTNAGMAIKEGGNPVVRQNRINKNGYEGIWIYENGGGTFEDNDLRDNLKGAWDIDDESEPNVKRARNLE